MLCNIYRTRSKKENSLAFSKPPAPIKPSGSSFTPEQVAILLHKDTGISEETALQLIQREDSADAPLEVLTVASSAIMRGADQESAVKIAKWVMFGRGNKGMRAVVEKHLKTTAEARPLVSQLPEKYRSVLEWFFGFSAPPEEGRR